MKNFSFKTCAYRNNSNFLINNDHIITEYDGYIKKLNISEKISPEIVGEYGFSVWNISLAVSLNIDVFNLLNYFKMVDSYSELITSINKNEINLLKYKKMLLIDNFILRNDYKKMGLCEEFIEMIYRDYYDSNTLIIFFVKPIQNNSINYHYYSNIKVVNSEIPAFNYYELDKLNNKKDIEINEYKIFGVAKKCGLDRIGGSYLFKLNHRKILNRIIRNEKNNDDKN